LFINGELQSAFVATPSGVLLGKRGVPLIVGRAAPGVPQRNFFGYVDELRIWSVCRSIDDIARHWNRRSHGDEEHLVLYVNGESGADIVSLLNIVVQKSTHSVNAQDVTGNCVAKRDNTLAGDALFVANQNAPVEAPLNNNK
jgi:hypothetical protein